MASTRNLVTIETDATNADRGKLFALDPADATGVAIPTIKMVNILPAKGTVKGETVALQPDNSLYTWDGGSWTRLVGIGGTNCPVGAIATWPTSTPPAGWLLCNGSQFDTTAFPDLFALLGKNTTPNLSDLFVRGARNAADVGVETPWSTAFKAAMKTGQGGGHNHTGNTGQSAAQIGTTEMTGSHHQHWYTSPLINDGGNSGAGSSGGGNKSAADPHPDGKKTWTNGSDTADNGAHTHTFNLPVHAHTISTQPDHEHNLIGGDAETAPKNVRLWYIICASSTSTLQSVQHTFLLGPVANQAALPTAGNTNGDVRITLDNSHMHVWHGSAAVPGNTPHPDTTFTERDIGAGVWEVAIATQGGLPLTADGQLTISVRLNNVDKTTVLPLTTGQTAVQIVAALMGPLGASLGTGVTLHPAGATFNIDPGTGTIGGITVTAVTGGTPASGQWNDIGPTNGLTLPPTTGLTDDRDLVFNHVTGQLEWRTLAHELPIPSQATELYIPRINAAGTAYEVVAGMLWLSPVADRAHLPATGNTLGQAAIALDTGHVNVWTPGAGVPDPGKLARVAIVNTTPGTYTITFEIEGNTPLVAGVAVQVDLEFQPGGIYHVPAQGNPGQSQEQLAGNWASIANNTVGTRITATAVGNVVTLVQKTGQNFIGARLVSITGAGWFDPTTPGWVDVTDHANHMIFREFHDVTQPLPAALANAREGTVILNLTEGQPHASWNIPAGPDIPASGMVIKLPGDDWLPVGGSGGADPGTVLVANEAARLALTPTDGTLVVQQDTGWTWRYQAAMVGDPFWSPWRVFSDYVGANTIAARNALAPHIHIGTLVSVGTQMYQYRTNPNANMPGEPPGIFMEFGGQVIISNQPSDEPTHRPTLTLASGWMVDQAPPTTQDHIFMPDTTHIQVFTATNAADYLGLANGTVIHSTMTMPARQPREFTLTAAPTQAGNIVTLTGTWDQDTTGITVFRIVTAPQGVATGDESDVFYNSADHRLWVHDSASWTEVTLAVQGLSGAGHLTVPMAYQPTGVPTPPKAMEWVSPPLIGFVYETYRNHNQWIFKGVSDLPGLANNADAASDFKAISAGPLSNNGIPSGTWLYFAQKVGFHPPKDFLSGTHWSTVYGTDEGASANFEVPRGTWVRKVDDHHYEEIHRDIDTNTDDVILNYTRKGAGTIDIATHAMGGHEAKQWMKIHASTNHGTISVLGATVHRSFNMQIQGTKLLPNGVGIDMWSERILADVDHDFCTMGNGQASVTIEVYKLAGSQGGGGVDWQGTIEIHDGPNVFTGSVVLDSATVVPQMSWQFGGPGDCLLAIRYR